MEVVSLKIKLLLELKDSMMLFFIMMKNLLKNKKKERKKNQDFNSLVNKKQVKLLSLG